MLVCACACNFVSFCIFLRKYSCQCSAHACVAAAKVIRWLFQERFRTSSFSRRRTFVDHPFPANICVVHTRHQKRKMKPHPLVHNMKRNCPTHPPTAWSHRNMNIIYQRWNYIPKPVRSPSHHTNKSNYKQWKWWCRWYNAISNLVMTLVTMGNVRNERQWRIDI